MARRLRAGHQTGDFRAAFERGIDQALRRQFLDRLAIARKMFGLPPHRRLPGDAEPGEILVYGGLEFGPAARSIDVLDAQQQAPPAARARSKLSSAE